jgi:hypothetical protein
MRAGFSFSYPSISLLLGQPLSIKRAMQERYKYIALACLKTSYEKRVHGIPWPQSLLIRRSIYGS